MRRELLISDLNDIKVHTVLLGEGIKGFVYVSRKNVPHVFINETLSEECTAETLAHEIFHIKFDKTSHGIGLDKQLEKSEQKADKFATQNLHKVLSLVNSTINTTSI